MSSLPEPRGFSRERDLAPLLALVGRLRASARGSSFLHPGGLQWLLRRLVDPDFAVRLWYEGDDLVGFIIEDGEYAMPHADPSRLDLLDLVAWSEEHARAAHRRAIEISIWDDDARLLDAIATRGYRPSGTIGHEYACHVDAEPPLPVLPPGYRFVPFDAAMDDAYVEMHRDSWSTIAPSTYRRALHDIVTSMPLFDRELVPIVAAPDGTLAAYCIGWLDPVSRTTEIEPLGTRPAHRRVGLARAVVIEILRRSWERGAHSVIVWTTDPSSTTHTNEPARRLYRSCGLGPVRTMRDHRLDL